MTTTTAPHDDDLRALADRREAEAAAARAELERRESDRAEAEAERQRQADARLVLAAAGIDAELQQSTRQAEAEFTAALERGDLTAAFLAFVARKASRPARQALRDAQRSAEQNAETGVRLLAPEMLAYDASTFIDAVQAEAERLGSERGYELGQQLVAQTRDGEVA